jgi:hydroxymethylbilane synthase
MNISIGTRGSKLALWQAEHVQQLLTTAGLTAHLVIIDTKGDKILDRSLAKIGSKGLFTEELEQQLREGNIHLAVHSAKDVQSELPADLPIVAFTEREHPADVLVSTDRGITLNSTGLVVGTSSVRRKAFLRRHYPQVQVVDVRGNLQTRFRKMEEGHCDALLLAYAGVKRMNFSKFIVQELALNSWIPPVGQGSIAVQASTELSPELLQQITAAVQHHTSALALRCERAFLRELEGGCSIPAYGLAQVLDEQLQLTAGLISPDGTTDVRVQQHGPLHSPEVLGTLVAQQVKQQGGEHILQALKA